MSRCSGLGSTWVVVGLIPGLHGFVGGVPFQNLTTGLHTAQAETWWYESRGEDNGNPTNKHKPSTGPGSFNRHGFGELVLRAERREAEQSTLGKAKELAMLVAGDIGGTKTDLAVYSKTRAEHYSMK